MANKELGPTGRQAASNLMTVPIQQSSLSAQLGTKSKYRYSYSGTDVKVIANFSAVPSEMVLLESAHTISWSVHEAKGPVRALGHRGVKGFARGVRTIAGSLITTVIEDHPMRELMELYVKLAYPSELNDIPNYKIAESGWSVDGAYTGIGGGKQLNNIMRRLVPRLPPIDIYLSYVSELDESLSFDRFNKDGQQVRGEVPEVNAVIDTGVWIMGVEFIDEGSVTSVNDSVTEMTYSFMARDVKNMIRYRGLPPFEYQSRDWATTLSINTGAIVEATAAGRSLEGPGVYAPELPWVNDATGDLLQSIANPKGKSNNGKLRL